MEKSENNRGIIIALVGVIIVMLLTLCVLFATGTISFGAKTNNNASNSAGNNINNTEDNNTVDTVETTTKLSNAEAINIVKKLYNADVRYIYNQIVTYCGEMESGEGAYLSVDNFNYTKSKSFKNLTELENHLKTYMTESLLKSSNYNRSTTINGKEVTSYIEKDGALYCNGWNKGSNMELAHYVEDETTIETSNIDEDSFDAKIDAVYYDVSYEENKSASTKTIKNVSVTVVKQNGNWLLDKYSE